METPKYQNHVYSANWTECVFNLEEIYNFFIRETPLNTYCRYIWPKPVMISCKLSFATLNIFGSGKCSIVGCKEEECVTKVVDWAAKELCLLLSNVKFCYCMATIKIPERNINLPLCQELFRGQQLNSQYEPELFSALVLRRKNITANIFHTGSVNVFGVRNKTDVNNLIDFLCNAFMFLNDCKIILLINNLCT